MTVKSSPSFAKYKADKDKRAKEGSKSEKAMDKKDAKLPAFMKKK